MSIPRGSYSFALNPDGTCCRFVLVDANTFVNLLFPATAADTTTPIGAAENAGEVTTKDISTFLFPNTYLYVGSLSNCCILGFHSYDFEPGTPDNGNVEKRYVVNYSSWITPGLFGGGFQDGIEGLPNAVYPVTLPNGGNSYTYHPQNEALLQWVEFQSPSDAINGAYSYPDTTVLTAPSAPQNVNCQ
jgi:hypothetical protein